MGFNSSEQRFKTIEKEKRIDEQDELGNFS